MTVSSVLKVQNCFQSDNLVHGRFPDYGLKSVLDLFVDCKSNVFRVELFICSQPPLIYCLFFVGLVLASLALGRLCSPSRALVKFWCFTLCRFLVIKSAGLCSVLMYFNVTSPRWITSKIKWWRMSMCFFFFSRGFGGDVLSSKLVSLNPIRYHRSSGFLGCKPSLRHGIIRLSASAGTALAN